MALKNTVKIYLRALCDQLHVKTEHEHGKQVRIIAGHTLRGRDSIVYKIVSTCEERRGIDCRG